MEERARAVSLWNLHVRPWRLEGQKVYRIMAGNPADPFFEPYCRSMSTKQFVAWVSEKPADDSRAIARLRKQLSIWQGLVSLAVVIVWLIWNFK